MDGEFQLLKFWDSESGSGVWQSFVFEKWKGGEYVQGMWWGPQNQDFWTARAPDNRGTLNPQTLHPKPQNPKP